MSAPARTIIAFSIYILLTGFAFFFIPNLILPILGFPQTSEVWVRVVGLLAIAIGAYYFQCGRREDRTFIEATMYGRCVIFIGMSLLVLFRLGPPMLLLFGVIDLAGAIWTWTTLRAS